MLLSKLDEFTVIDTTRTNQNHTVSGVVGLDIRLEIIAVDGKDVLLGAENCATKSLTCNPV